MRTLNFPYSLTLLSPSQPHNRLHDLRNAITIILTTQGPQSTPSYTSVQTHHHLLHHLLNSTISFTTTEPQELPSTQTHYH